MYSSDEMAPSYFFQQRHQFCAAGLNGGLPVVTVNIPEVDVGILRVAPEKMPKFMEMVIGKPRSKTNDESEEDSGDAKVMVKAITTMITTAAAINSKVKPGWQLNALQGIAESVYQKSICDE